jgi:hypothetical protein
MNSETKTMLCITVGTNVVFETVSIGEISGSYGGEYKDGCLLGRSP